MLTDQQQFVSTLYYIDTTKLKTTIKISDTEILLDNIQKSSKKR